VARIPDHLIAEVRERADIVGIVGRYVTLKKSGPRHWGLCPFHNEKTPSFQVHEEKQIFHCFGCGFGGDVFSFRTRHDGLDFPDAVRAIAREVGVEILEHGESGGGGATPLYRANESALGYFAGVLRSDEGAEARRYLRSRGVTRELAQRFQIGAAPARWDGLLRHLERAAQPREVAERAGLVAQRRDGEGRYDRFRGRVMFPILEPSGRVLGFGGRQLHDDESGTPKYLNTAETPVYRKGRVLFGLPQALDAIRRARRVVVVEGYFDVLALHRAGVEETVAPCGTALTADHGKRIRRYAPEVVLLFDGDEAGRQAAERALPVLLAEGLRVRAAFLAPGDDPDTFLEREGAEALRACVDGAVPLLRHLMDRQFSRKTRERLGAADVAQVLAPLLQAVPDPLERRDHLHEVATYLRLEDAELDEAVRGYTKSLAARETPNALESHIEEEVKIDPVSRVLLEALASHPDLLDAVGRVRLEWLPPGEGCELLGQVLSSAAERGDEAVSWLCSESAENLRPGLRAALRRIVMQAGPVDRASALQAVRDCLARLEDCAMDEEMRDLRARIETCRDPVERETLLEKVQATLERRRRLRPVCA
jgi:DNA primase